MNALIFDYINTCLFYGNDYINFSMYITISDQFSAVSHPTAERRELYLISSVLANSAASIQQGIPSSSSHIPREHLSELK